MMLDGGLLDYDLQAVARHARRMEAIGFDCLWTSETQHDPFLPLAVASTVTSSIKLGTCRKPRLGGSSWDSGRK